MPLRRLKLQGKRVLVVDDDEDNREMLKVALRAHGLAVELAGDGTEALQAVTREKPDLILCDLLMPRLDGFAMVQQLRGMPEYSQIPVIALSGLGSDEDVMRTWEAGFSGHLVKPIDFDVITAQLERVFWAAGLSEAEPTGTKRASEGETEGPGSARLTERYRP